MNIRIFLISIAAIFHSGDSAGNPRAFLDEVTKCCQRGFMEARQKQNPNCQAISQTSGAISGLVCRTAAELCCMKALQESVCNMGTSVAINGSTCSAQPAGREDHQECCYCCYLGMKAKKQTMGCRGSSVLGMPCQKAFLRCCSLPDPHPSGMPNVFGPPVRPTTPVRRITCSSLGCSQTCEYRNGSPACTCRSGFIINRDGRTCNDKNECLTSGICRQNEVCKNLYGSYECTTSKVTCPAGHKVDPSGQQCQDVNECEEQSPCKADQICKNTRGSFECDPRCPSTFVYRNNRCEKICRPGFLLDRNRCVDENECQRSGVCQSNERCVNTIGSYRCERKKALKCNSGYKPDEATGTKCVDVDECAVYGSKRLCGSKTCVNVPASYRCIQKCNAGYELDTSTSTCKDVDECVTLRIRCQRNAKCENRPGSYGCICNDGYYLSRGTCLDVDECRNNICGAGETCINTPGAYRCDKRLSCRPGYILRRGVCVDVNECLDRGRCSADKECINTRGSYECKVRCSQGYERINDDCRDIDECTTGNYNCRSDEQCQNRPGAYRCIKVQRCPTGYEPFNGKCEDKDECQIPNICRPPTPVCKNLPGTYRCEFPGCSQGFRRNRYGQCEDVNECARKELNICIDKAEECINVNGTYSCRCNPGYIRTGGDRNCRDRDECRGANQFCAHTCVNTEGSFRCECRKGYRLTGRTNCIDEDECNTRSAKCQHNCINTQGSYYCRCNPGYTLRSDGASCVDINECNKPNQFGSCSYRCTNSPGSFKCSCPQGYELRYSRYCVDIDECAAGNPCGSGACVNTRGGRGYQCLVARCPDTGYHIKRSARHCARRACKLDDAQCLSETRKSIRWHGRGLPNNAKVGAFSYMYNITPTGYKTRPQIKFTIKRGNRDGAFRVYSRGYGKSVLRNVVPLKGPRQYQLEFVGEVIDGGVVRATFIANLNVWVSEFDF